VVLEAYRQGVPIFVPAFADSSAGFGLVIHRWAKGKDAVAVDSGKDFYELTKVKISSRETGIFMLGVVFPRTSRRMLWSQPRLWVSQLPCTSTRFR